MSETKRPMLLGALGGGVGAFVFVILGTVVAIQAYYFGDQAASAGMLGVILATPLGVVLGTPVALVVTRVVTGIGRLQSALLPLATGLAVGFIVAAGYWLCWIALLDVVRGRG